MKESRSVTPWVNRLYFESPRASSFLGLRLVKTRHKKPSSFVIRGQTWPYGRVGSVCWADPCKISISRLWIRCQPTEIEGRISIFTMYIFICICYVHICVLVLKCIYVTILVHVYVGPHHLFCVFAILSLVLYLPYNILHHRLCHDITMHLNAQQLWLVNLSTQ